MEAVLPVRSSICCKRELYSRSNSVCGLFAQRRASESSYWTGCVARTSFQVITCSGFSSRRQQKRSLRGLKGRNTREVMRQTLLDTDSRHRDVKYDRSPKNLKAPSHSKTATPDKEIVNREAKSEESAEKFRGVSAVEIVEFPSPGEKHGVGNGSVRAVMTEVHNGENDTEHSAKDESGWHEKYTTGNSGVIKISRQDAGDGVSEELEHGEGCRSLKRGKDEISLGQKLDMELIHKKELEAFAEEMFMEGNKFFVYPKVASAGDDIELFFHRAISTLNSESDISVKGAFNDWQWRPFTVSMSKSCLQGDWWSCHLTIPMQAYKMNFVFFNGKDIYENNDANDFCIHLNCEMDASAFEEFLLKEKKKELEKLAVENVKKEREEEEKRRVQAEKAASEFNRMKARVETEMKKEALQKLVENAVPSLSNVWFIGPSDFEWKDMIRLYYNRNSGPLADANEIFIHGGYNNWQDGLSIVEKCTCSAKKDQEWCYTDVVVPDGALVLDWVFADGPPQNAKVYDNNHSLDFHAIVPLHTPEEVYWMEEERNVFKKLEKERKLREDSLRAKAKRSAIMKAESKRKGLRKYLWSQRHVMYSEPLDVRAGDLVTVFYNPANTALKGKSEVWLRYSFNHWTHSKGLFPCQRMLPADNTSYVKTTIKVPLDAYSVDFVFSEREDGGIFDNKNGMDYHIPVSGGLLKEPPMHIVHISVEMAPIAKVGGLGDVVTSLSRAVQDLNHNVEIILPKYDCLDHSFVNDFQFRRSFAWGGTEIKVWFGRVEGLPVYFLEPQNGFFSTGCIYGCKNDDQRFGFFCHAALEFLFQNGSNPDIIHCHDWSSAPVAWLYKEQHYKEQHYMNNAQNKSRIVFTIHNLEFGAHFIGKAMAYADTATTVSPTYSREVSGNSAIAPHLLKFHGVLNGIDPDIWDPYNDKYIPVSYARENVVEGKKAAKAALQQKLGLRKSDLPVVGIVSRLTPQKGIHLIKHAIWRTLDRSGQVVLLGAAPDHRIQNDFVNLANQLHSSHADQARLCLTYDEPLSHLIYAGADFIVVPSIFEPCGLTQLIAMRYGSIPIVRKTGGLYDTVFDVDNDKGRAQAHGVEPNGFNFDGADAGGIDYALNRAISMWYEKREEFEALCGEVMEQDWSWNRPALDYMELYRAIRK